MNINLRGISQELHQALKVRAATEGVSLQSLCVRFMWLGLDVHGATHEKAVSQKFEMNQVLLEARDGTGRVDGDDEGAKAGGGGKRASVSGVRAAKSVAKQLPIDTRSCATCGSVNGVHQKGCIGK